MANPNPNYNNWGQQDPSEDPNGFQGSDQQETPFGSNDLQAVSYASQPPTTQSGSQNVDMDTDAGNADSGLNQREWFLAQMLQQELNGPPADVEHYNSIMYGDPAGQNQSAWRNQEQGNNFMNSDPRLRQSPGQFPWPDPLQGNTFMRNPADQQFPGQYPSREQWQNSDFMINQPPGQQFPSQYPSPPPVLPDPRLAAGISQQPVLGFVTSGQRAVRQSASGPLDVPDEFPCPTKHQTLKESDPRIKKRQLLHYVDSSRQRPGDTLNDYALRLLRCNENMGLEVRQQPTLGPIPGQHSKDQEYLDKYQELRTQIGRNERGNRARMTLDSDYDADYVRNWGAGRAARQARNAQRRAAALQRLQNEYEHIGHPDLPSPPPPDVSGDELHTFNAKGPIGSLAGNKRSQNKGSGGSGKPPRDEELPSATGRMAYSSDRCEPCKVAKEKCSIRETGRPCDRCVRRGTEEKCVPAMIHRRGRKLGKAIGKYKKRGDQAPRSRSESPERSPSPLRGPRPPCINCSTKSRNCTPNRPCDPCKLWGEEHLCDANIQGQNYNAEPDRRGRMTDYRWETLSNPPMPTFGNDQGFRTSPRQQRPQWDTAFPHHAEDVDEDEEPFSAARNTFRGGNMQNSTPQQELQWSSETWIGGAERNIQRTAFGAPQLPYENLYENQTVRTTGFSPFSIQNNTNIRATSNNIPDDLLNPHIRETQNPPLPRNFGVRTRASPDNQNENNLPSPTDSEVLPLIKDIRRKEAGPDKSGLTNAYGCNETVGLETGNPHDCDQKPTMPCDHLEHGWFNVCEECWFRSDTMYLAHIAKAIHTTKLYMCKECADVAREQVRQYEDRTDVQIDCCLCVGQMKKAWLCDFHRSEAIQRVTQKASNNGEWRRRRVWNGKTRCPNCNLNDPDDRSGAWQCEGCGDKVVQSV